MLKPVTPRQLMSAEEFMVWAEAQPREAGKFELWDGEVIMTRGPSDGPLELQSERSLSIGHSMTQSNAHSCRATRSSMARVLSC
jgi:hypothetical protein